MLQYCYSAIFRGFGKLCAGNILFCKHYCRVTFLLLWRHLETRPLNPPQHALRLPTRPTPPLNVKIGPLKFAGFPNQSPLLTMLGVICKTNSSLFKFAEKHQPWVFQKILSKLLMMACMRDLCIRHELIGTLLSESISTLLLYFGSKAALIDERWEIFLIFEP